MKDLAVKMRPKNLDEFVGQKHIVGQNCLLYKSIKSRKIPNCIFYGPPGCGKTTLARIIAREIGAQIGFFNATNFKIENLREFIFGSAKGAGRAENGDNSARVRSGAKNAQNNTFSEFSLFSDDESNFGANLQKQAGQNQNLDSENLQKSKLIFIDEIHRLNKAQQEFLLPILEEGAGDFRVNLIGASTYNPFHSLTHALRSRSFLFELKPLAKNDLINLMSQVLKKYNICLPSECESYIVESSSGDARAMLNLLDVLLDSAQAVDSESLNSEKQACEILDSEISKSSTPKMLDISLDDIKALRPNALNEGTSEDDMHYKTISALIKSVRGSDVNAAIYYLARLIDAGETPEFIARRLAILASEDIGNANPNALNIATSTLLCVEKIGYPEARIILAQCVIYLASSPKSNTAYKAINLALDCIKNGEILPTCENILPDSKNYLYPHDFGGFVEQKYLEKPLKFVERTNKGFEKNLNEWLDKIYSIGKKD